MLAMGLVVATASDASAFCRSTTCTGECKRDADEFVDAGRTVSHVTAETTNRGLWRHYRSVMAGDLRG